MSRSLSYADAVRILGGEESRLLAAADRVAGGLLLSATAGGSALALSLFDAKSELFRTSQALVTDLADRLGGLHRIDRTLRLTAGHAALVVGSYFGALTRMDPPIPRPALEVSGVEQVHLATGARPDGDRLGDLADALLRSDVPVPKPHQPYEELLAEIERFYRRLSEVVERFLTGLAAWDSLDDTTRAQVSAELRGSVVTEASADYRSAFRRMANDVPEFGLWISLLDHQATRGEVRAGVAALQTLLDAMNPQRLAQEKRTALSRAYTAALSDPILDAESGEAGPRIPDIASSYINPSFRVAAPAPQDPIASEEWWGGVPPHEDLMRYLVGHLTSVAATVAPLLLLGQPGSGKSLLTRMLAATLPPDDFVVVRVSLRDVPADAPLQVQIEQAVFDATGERATWPEVVRAVPGAQPVVLLDGFDELLQATGVSQWDYLENVARFQRRESAEGRSVAVVVTTRTSVADRTRPAAETVALRLEPFTDSQIGQWLAIWNDANDAYFRSVGLRPLSPAALTQDRELASQPLLLLMLAIYDAQENALGAGTETGLDQADLYERLLTGFARREVRKADRGHPDDQEDELIEAELLRLAMVAFAAFNRGRQWVTRADLDTDLPILLPGTPADAGTTATVRRRLTVAETLLGRFFFIHEARARREGQTLQTFEFLHATFGEYLIARSVERELADLVGDVLAHRRRSRAVPADDSFLHALLSFAIVSQRRTTYDFLGDRFATWDVRSREALRTLLLVLFQRALEPRESNRFTGYAPVPAPVPARHASYSANLVLLLVAAEARVTTDDLFPDADDPIDAWRRITQLWRSQLRPDAWSRLVGSIGVRRTWNGERRVLDLVRDTGWPEASPPDGDLYWTRDVRTADKSNPEWTRGHFSWTQANDRLRQWQANFHGDPAEDLSHHALLPLARTIDEAVTMVHGYWEDRAVSAARSLIELWTVSTGGAPAATVIVAFRHCLTIARWGFAPNGAGARRAYRIALLHTLRQNRAALGDSEVEALRKDLARPGAREPDDLAELIATIR